MNWLYLLACLLSYLMQAPNLDTVLLSSPTSHRVNTQLLPSNELFWQLQPSSHSCSSLPFLSHIEKSSKQVISWPEGEVSLDELRFFKRTSFWALEFQLWQYGLHQHLDSGPWDTGWMIPYKR